MENIKRLQGIANQIRRDVLRMTNSRMSGHPGAPLGCAELFAALYFEVMKHNPEFNLSGKNEDMFFLSSGHLSAGWYSALSRSGYFPVSELASFRVLNSRLQGHPTNADNLPGIRVASGSLGQGLSVAAGAALAKKMQKDNKLVYCLTGDGELQEGQIWEAVMFAAARKIDNLIAIVDYNNQQIDGSVEEVMSLGNLKSKWEAFDWTVLECDGNNLQDLLDTLKLAKEKAFKNKPIVILMRTEMGEGVDFMRGTNKWHGVAPNNEQLEIALAQIEETLGDY
ncbi:MAG: transketolase [Bacteroidales bacterium]|nr:transketolase [Bacteroidales bacterium]